MRQLVPTPARIWLALRSRAPGAGPLARIAVAVLVPVIALAWLFKACHWAGRAAILAPFVAVGLALRLARWLFLASIGLGLVTLALDRGADWAAARLGIERPAPEPSQPRVRRSTEPLRPARPQPVLAAAALVAAPTPEPAAAGRAPAAPERIGRSPADPERRKAGREGLLRPGL